ncbi:MAG: hypothetical protein WCO58_01250 [bacterium]
MENNEYKTPTITAVGEDGAVVSLSQEMLDKQQLDDINLQLVSEIDPVKKAELEAQAKELEDKLGLEAEHQLAA